MRICLYGASSSQIDPKYIEETEQFGRELARRGHSLVYGGGAQGLMGAAARGVKELNGEILGVAPTFFMDVDGALFERCTKFIYTETMRERKQCMEDNADAFVVVPGGIGTFEEFFEILTLKQLGRHGKPIVVYNMFGYYDTVKMMIEQAIKEQFMKPACRELCAFLDTPEKILDYMEGYQAEQEATSSYKFLRK